MISLEEINSSNWRIKLKVSEEQKAFVSDTNGIMARAYAYRTNRSQVKMIYNGEVPIGILLFYDCDELGGYDFSQILIDERYQGKGYGSQAAELVIDWMRSDKKYDKVYLCYMEGNESARKMYEKLGFQHTGERDEDEIIMVLDL